MYKRQILNRVPVLFTLSKNEDGKVLPLVLNPVQNYQGSIELIKQNEAGEPLSGAKFELRKTDEENKLIAEITSDKNGKIHYEGLAPVSYTHLILVAVMTLLVFDEKDADHQAANVFHGFLRCLKNLNTWLIAFIVMGIYTVHAISQYIAPFATNAFGTSVLIGSLDVYKRQGLRDPGGLYDFAGPSLWPLKRPGRQSHHEARHQRAERYLKMCIRDSSRLSGFWITMIRNGRCPA